MQLRSLLLLLAVPVSLTRSANAQHSEAEPGTRVRITAPGVVAGAFEGTIIARRADSVEIASPQRRPMTVALARITSMEISRGASRSDGAVRGVMWGGSIGLLLGLVTLPALECNRSPCTVSDDTKAGYVLLNGIAGVGWGAIIGAIASRERWERLDLAAMPTLGLRDGRAALSMTLAY